MLERAEVVARNIDHHVGFKNRTATMRWLLAMAHSSCAGGQVIPKIAGPGRAFPRPDECVGNWIPVKFPFTSTGVVHDQVCLRDRWGGVLARKGDRRRLPCRDPRIAQD